MSYEYEPTAAEHKAAKLLRGKGWSVNEPACPLCHGWGTVPRYQTWQLVEVINEPTVWSGTLSHDACPNGCTLGGFYFDMPSLSVVP